MSDHEIGTAWRIERRSVSIAGLSRTLRLARFDAGWLASVDTNRGPTLGFDASPYLAIGQALEPLGVELVDAMRIAGPVPR